MNSREPGQTPGELDKLIRYGVRAGVANRLPPRDVRRRLLHCAAEQPQHPRPLQQLAAALPLAVWFGPPRAAWGMAPGWNGLSAADAVLSAHLGWFSFYQLNR